MTDAPVTALTLYVCETKKCMHYGVGRQIREHYLGDKDGTPLVADAIVCTCGKKMRRDDTIVLPEDPAIGLAELERIKG